MRRNASAALFCFAVLLADFARKFAGFIIPEDRFTGGFVLIDAIDLSAQSDPAEFEFECFFDINDAPTVLSV